MNLFSSSADQIYGDQEMNSVVRNMCIDYMVRLYIVYIVSVSCLHGNASKFAPCPVSKVD